MLQDPKACAFRAAKLTKLYYCRMQLKLRLDIKSLKGPIYAWIPPPPGDRLWFAFVTPPKLVAAATPLVTPLTLLIHFYDLLHQEFPLLFHVDFRARFKFCNRKCYELSNILFILMRIQLIPKQAQSNYLVDFKLRRIESLSHMTMISSL